MKYGLWEVTKEGHLIGKDHYEISNDRLKSADWILHLSKKGWVNMNDFIPAYFEACKINKIKNVTIQTCYQL